MKFMHIAPAIALAVSTLSAQAVATDWAAHDVAEVGVGLAVGPGASLLDTFSFTLSGPVTITYTTVTNDFGLLDLAGSTLSLYSGLVGSGTFVASQSFDMAQVQGMSNLLTPGAYYYEVSSSVAPNAFAGSYTLTSTVSPIPEPETLALMVAGLLSMGMLMSRRRGEL